MRSLFTSKLPDSSRVLLYIVTGALIIRFAAVVPVHSKTYTSDEREYIFLAHQVLETGKYIDSNGDRAVRAPLFPLLLAGIFATAGSGLVVPHVVGCLLGALSIGLGYSLSLRLGNRPTASLIVAGVIGLAPGLVIYSALLQTETLYIVFFLSAFLFVYRIIDGGGVLDGLGLGIAAGLATLTRAEYLPFFPILLVSVWIVREKLIRQLAKQLTLALVVFCLLLAPWTVRNYRVLHELVPVSSISGWHFLYGNNPFSHGSPKLDPGYEKWVSEKAKSRGVENYQILGEIQQGRIMREIAWDYIASHPVRSVQLVFQKAYVYWIYPITHSDSYLPIQAVAVGCDFILLLGVAFGAVVTWFRWRRLVPLYGALVVFTLIHIVLTAEARYRLPLVPLLCVFFGAGALLLFDKEEAKRFIVRRPLRIAAGALCVGIVLIYGLTGWLFLRGMV